MADIVNTPNTDTKTSVRQSLASKPEPPSPGKKFLGIRHAMVVPLIVACAMFMEMVDANVITTALPLIARDFGKDPLTLKLGLSAYLISLAVFIPISGWIADRFGSRVVFCAAITIFMVSSMLCGLAQSFAFFVALRFIQGIGGAMMVPVGRIVIVRTVEREDLVTAFIYLTIPATLGPLTGPVLGGFIATYFSWRWIFFINVPISIVGIIFALRFMDNYRESEVPPLDVVGFVLSALGLSLFMFGMSTISDQMMPRKWAAICIVMGAVIVYAYLRRARTETKPLLDFSFFKLKTYMVGVGGGSIYRIGFGAIPFLLPLMLQLGFGLSPFRSGVLTCASAIGSLFIRTMTKKLLQIFGFRNLLGYNALLASITIAALGLFTARTPHTVIFLVLLVGGGFRVMQFTALNTICYAEVPERDVSQATSLFATIQQLSMGMGVTVGAFCLQASNFFQHHSQIVAADFAPAFLAVGLFCAVSAYSAFSLSPDSGAEMAGRAATGSANS
jgi:EmrB/QacA subfamily drug resistance transporter